MNKISVKSSDIVSLITIDMDIQIKDRVPLEEVFRRIDIEFESAKQDFKAKVESYFREAKTP